MTDPVDPIYLTANILDPSHFIFIAENWERELKPYKRAKWTHESDREFGGTHSYELKSGHFLAFPGIDRGGFYAAHLYAVCKELAEVTGQVKASLTEEGLTLVAVESRARFVLKPRGCNVNDSIHHAILGYHS